MAGVITGNVQSISVVSVALTPSAAGAATATEQTFTVPGVLASDVVLSVNKPTAQTGLVAVSARVTAANTVGIVFVNPTAGSITPTAGETYKFILARADSTQAGFNV
jgi:hypothetical protein